MLYYVDIVFPPPLDKAFMGNSYLARDCTSQRPLHLGVAIWLALIYGMPAEVMDYSEPKILRSHYTFSMFSFPLC